MGIDVSLKIRSKKLYTAEELDLLNYRFLEASSLGNRPRAIILGEQIENDPHFYYEIKTGLRYYGIGYERGPWDIISSAINWLRFNFSEEVILYSGDCDSSSVFTEEDQKELDEHWYTHGGIPYHWRKSEYNRICPNCHMSLSQYIFGGTGKAGLICLGCEFRESTLDGGKTWMECET
jgi:hypothetical protein